MNLATLILSSLSLIAVIGLGLKANVLGQRSAKASEKSAEASVAAAEAIERSVAASERAAGLAAQDARVRRIEAVLDTLLEMRQLFSEQRAAHEDEVPEWKLSHHSLSTWPVLT